MAALGVGIIFNGVLGPFLARHPDVVDYVSVIPERFWLDRGGCHLDGRFTPLAAEVASLDALAERYPIVAHGIGLSIGSACTFDRAHVRQLDAWARRYRFAWISEHLSAVRVRTQLSADHHAGLAIPLPFDEDVLAMVSERVGIVEDILSQPILLENGVVHTPVPDPEMSETAFLNRLTAGSGCRVLLDLHNLLVNTINLGGDAERFLDQLDLGTVQEIHIAGGDTLYGVYLDSHAGPCPDEVWRLLDLVVPRCPKLRGITYEFHETYYERLMDEGILAQLDRARHAWNATHAPRNPCPSPNTSARFPISSPAPS